jgi:hypothetical protein
VTKAEKLAALLLADRDRPTQNHNIVPCFVCGYTFVYKGRQGELNGRFCSLRCQDWYDAGNPSYEQQREHERKLLHTPIEDLTIIAGPPGVEVGSRYRPFGDRPAWDGRCAFCRKEFSSTGLRCCSKECEKSYLDRQANLATLKEAGIEPIAKRMCEGPDCDRPIPKWKNGRQVSSKVRFCSPLCRKRANRILEAQSTSIKQGTF